MMMRVALGLLLLCSAASGQRERRQGGASPAAAEEGAAPQEAVDSTVPEGDKADSVLDDPWGSMMQQVKAMFMGDGGVPESPRSKELEEQLAKLQELMPGQSGWIVEMKDNATEEEYAAVKAACAALAGPGGVESHDDLGVRMILVLNVGDEEMDPVWEMPGVELIEEYSHEEEVARLAEELDEELLDRLADLDSSFIEEKMMKILKEHGLESLTDELPPGEEEEDEY